MPVTTITVDITHTSRMGTHEATMEAIARATAKVFGIEGIEVDRVEELFEGGKVVGYQVTLKVRHVLEDEASFDPPAHTLLHPWPFHFPLRIDEHGVVRVGETRVTLDSVVAALRSGKMLEEILESYPTLSLADVEAVSTYYFVYRQAVDAYVAKRRKEALRLREEILETQQHAPTSLRSRLLARREGER